MYKRILLAYDGSESGQKALIDCKEIAQWSDASLTLVAVMPHQIDFIGAEGGFYDPKITEREQLNYQAVMEQGLRVLADAGRAATGEVVVGDMVSEITDYARKMKADLIVVGHKHIDSWAARWWRGSSSSALIEHAPCSVLMVITH